jgi:hypothetical protein
MWSPPRCSLSPHVAHAGHCPLFETVCTDMPFGYVFLGGFFRTGSRACKMSDVAILFCTCKEVSCDVDSSLAVFMWNFLFFEGNDGGIDSELSLSDMAY